MAEAANSICQPVIVHVDGRQMSQSPVRKAIHDLADRPEFDDSDLVLQRVVRILQDEITRRKPA